MNAPVLSPLADAVEKATAVVEALQGLIGESQGVYGLHLNGDPSPWDEIVAGGRFERLPDLDEALAALRALPIENMEQAARRLEVTIGLLEAETTHNERLRVALAKCESGRAVAVLEAAQPSDAMRDALAGGGTTIHLNQHQAQAVVDRLDHLRNLSVRHHGHGYTCKERVALTYESPYNHPEWRGGLFMRVEGRGMWIPLFAKDLGHERNFEASRLGMRDEDGFVNHPDMDGIGFDEFDMGPQLRALGWESATVCFESDAPDDVQERRSDSNEADCSDWTPSRPSGDGWLLASIYDTEDGPVALYVRAALAAPEGDGPKLPGFVKPDTDKQVFFYEQDFYVLSNFSAFNLAWSGLVFPTSEHCYHWLKFNRGEGGAVIQKEILSAPSAHEAFKIAERRKTFRRPEWDSVKVELMRDILRAKADQHEYVRRKLLATGDRELIEDSWRDDFWGWGPNRDGKNMLGKLWMEIRAELRAAPGKGA